MALDVLLLEVQPSDHLDFEMLISSNLFGFAGWLSFSMFYFASNPFNLEHHHFTVGVITVPIAFLNSVKPQFVPH